LVFFFWVKDPIRKNYHGEHAGLGITEFLQKDIGFSAEQLQKFGEMKNAHKEKMKPLFENLSKTKEHFYQLMKDPAVAESTLDSGASVIGQKQKELDLQTFRYFKNLRNLCTPDQLSRFDSLFPNILQKMTGSHRVVDKRPSEKALKK
jgi:protein CpxP